MQYKELKAVHDSLIARYKASDSFLLRASIEHALRAIRADLDTLRTASADAGEFLSRHRLYDSGNLRPLTPWEVTVAAAEELESLNRHRERTADSARFLWLYGSPLTRALIASGGMAPDITAEHADRLQRLRSKAADSAEWLYMNSAAEPCFMQVFFLGAGRAEIIRARDSFV